ncbi:MAG TPA: YhjD/YihY/BrkB family envelope integrity protein [Microlunatus sp.]
MTRAPAATGRPQPPGAEADRPQDIPHRGWVQILKRSWAQATEDQIPLLGAGVAFFGFLALFPTLIALVLAYGLFADPSTIADQVSSAGGALPAEVKDLIVTQLTEQSQRTGALSVGVIISLLLALWSASGGVANLVLAINTAYDETDQRTLVQKRVLALALTFGAIIFMIILVTLIAVLPIIFSVFEGGPLRWLVQVVRWVLIAVLIMIALAVLYRVAPDRDAPKMRWASPGAIVATLLWLVVSVGFSLYVTLFASYAKTYGALAGIVVLLMWLWLTSYAILFGAEINAEAEQQTIKDSTVGPEQPLGQRGAVAADSRPPTDRDADDDVDADDHAPSARGLAMTNGTEDRLPTTRIGDTVATAPPPDDSIAALITQMTEESSRLVRTELKLAQVEMTEKAKTAGVGIGAFGVAGVLALFGIGCLIATAIFALALVLPTWAAALIVAVIVLAVAGVAALLGKKKVSQATPPVPSNAVENVRADVAEIKESVRR